MMRRMFTGTTGIVFILICVMYFIEYIDRVNISVAAPLIKTELHLSNTQLGLALSAFGYCYAVFQIIFGYVGDKIGARRMLALNGILWAGGTLLTGLAGSLASLILARTVVGLGEAGTIPNATRAMSVWVPRVQRGFAQGFTHSAARLAAAITPPVVVAMIPFIGWRGAFFVLGALSLVWVVVWFLFFRDDPRDHPRISAAELAALPLPETSARTAPTVPWSRLLKRILPVTLVFFCHAWTLWLYLSWLPSFFVSEYGFDVKRSAMFSAGVFLAGVIGDTAGGLFTDALYRWTGDLNRARRDAIILGFGASLLLLTAALFLHGQFTVTLCLAGALFFLESAEGPIWAVPMDIAPQFAGIAGSFVSTAAGLAAVVSPAAFGVITDLTGSYKLPFVLSISLLAAGVALSFWIRADRPLKLSDNESRPQPAPARPGPRST